MTDKRYTADQMRDMAKLIGWDELHPEDIRNQSARMLQQAAEDCEDAERLAFVVENNWIGTKTRCEKRIQDGDIYSARVAIDHARIQEKANG